MYELAGKELTGKVAVKLHSGEKGNQNFLGPDFWRPVIEKVGGTVVECNTAYDGARDTTAKHRLLIKEHGWDRYFNVDLMDAEGPDMELAIPNGKQIKKNFVGKNMANYDSMLVLSPFQGSSDGRIRRCIKAAFNWLCIFPTEKHTFMELEIRLQSGQQITIPSLSQWQMQHPLLLNILRAILSMSM